jgi:CRISPR system Cascade subunit CasA
VEAHTFAAIHDESPLVTATVHRLLLAILQRVFLPRTMDDWIALWEATSFDAAKVRAYLTKWKDRFDLFHPERPFLQVANLTEVLRKERGSDPKVSEAYRLAMEQSPHSKNDMQLFEPLPNEPNIDPQRAVFALLGFLAFAAGGTIDNEGPWSGGNLRGGALVLLRPRPSRDGRMGETLHRTLLSNLVWQQQRAPKDVPPWERDEAPRRIVRAPYGLVDLLVWPSRRVELIAERDDRGELSVRGVISAAGERLNATHPDPMFVYVVRNPEKPPFPVRIDPERSVWRDAAALFEAAAGSDAFQRPAACTQMEELVRQGVVSRAARFQVELLGLASDQAVIDLWRADRMPLPPALLVDGPRVSRLREAVSLAEEVGEAIDAKVLRILAKSALAPSRRELEAKEPTQLKAEIQKLTRALGSMPAYWNALGEAFRPWLEELGTAEDLDAMLGAWKHALRATARDVVRDAEVHLGTSARALQAGAKAERALRRVLRDVLGDQSVVDAATAMGTTEGVPA